MRLVPVLVLAGGCVRSRAVQAPQSSDVDRGPTEIPLDADPNGLWWDAATTTLFVADDDGNRVMKWTDADGLSLVGALPEPTDLGLGQPVVLNDRVYVTRFGYGRAGDLAWVSVDGSENGTVSGLDPARRRIGLAATSDGRLLYAWFVSTDAGKSGGISFVDPAGTEAELVSTLVKPIGVLEIGGTVYASDQVQGRILAMPLLGGEPTVFATMDGPDLLAAGPDGSLFTGSVDGGVWRIDASGTVSRFASGAPETRGVAYDAANRRLFLARHDPDEADGVTHALLVVPVDP